MLGLRLLRRCRSEGSGVIRDGFVSVERDGNGGGGRTRRSSIRGGVIAKGSKESSKVVDSAAGVDAEGLSLVRVEVL